MGAHWTGACPRPGGSERIAFLPDLDELLDEAERLLGVTTDAFDGAPFTALVRERLAGRRRRRPRRRRAGAADAARRAPARRRRLVWSGSDVVLGDVDAREPELRALRRVARHPRAARGRPRRRRRGARSAAPARCTRCARGSSSSRPTRCARRRCSGHPASVPLPSGAYSTTSRRSCSRRGSAMLRPPRRRPATPTARGRRRRSASTAASAGCRSPTTMPFHGQVMQLDASPIPLAEDDPVVPGLDRRARAVLREGPAVGRPRRVLRRRRGRVRDAGHEHPLHAHRRAIMRCIDRARDEIVALGAGGRRAARRPPVPRCRSARRCTTRARRGWARPTTARASAAPTARCGRRRACSSPATA